MKPPTLVYEIRADILCPKGSSLSNITDSYLSNLATLGFDAIWLLGVWTRSPSALHYSTANLPPCMPRESAAASLFAVIDYHVDPAFGGDDALRTFKINCNRFGLSLLIDFVSNHLARDHFFVHKNPELLEQGGMDAKGPQFFSPMINQLLDVSTSSVPTGGEPKQVPSLNQIVLCHGRDAFGNLFGDTVQIKHRSTQSRKALLNTLLFIAFSNLADGVRCDMANNLSNDVIMRTWGNIISSSSDATITPPTSSSSSSPICAASGSETTAIVLAALTQLEAIKTPLPPIDGEFWTFAISRIKAIFPAFIFIGEWCSQFSSVADSSLSFDFVCDRDLAVSFTTSAVDGVLQHLRASALFERQESSTRNVKRRATFCEIHETNRIASVQGGDLAAQACAVIALAPPSGLRIIHDGQIYGRRVVHPVLIGPRDQEKVSVSTLAFYHNFLPLLKELNGSWHVASITPSRDGNSSWRSLVAFFITPLPLLTTTTAATIKGSSKQDALIPSACSTTTVCASGHSTHEQSESSSGSTITSTGSTLTDSSSPSSSTSSPSTLQVMHIQQVSSISSSTMVSSSTAGGFVASDFKALSIEPAQTSRSNSPDVKSLVIEGKLPSHSTSSLPPVIPHQRLPPTFLVICNLSNISANGHVLFSRADECAYNTKTGEQAVSHIQSLARDAGSDGNVLFVDRLAGGVSASSCSSALMSEGLWVDLSPFSKRILEIVSNSII